MHRLTDAMHVAGRMYRNIKLRDRYVLVSYRWMASTCIATTWKIILEEC